MADKTFTEAEHIAILADRVATETAELTRKNGELTAENATLKNEKDVLEGAKLAAETAKAAAEQALEDFKSESAQAAEIAKVRDERVKAVSDVFGEAYVTAERADRYAAMPEAEFAAFIDDLKAVAPKPGDPPAPSREAAALGGGAPAQPSGGSAGPSTASALLALQV